MATKHVPPTIARPLLLVIDIDGVLGNFMRAVQKILGPVVHNQYSLEKSYPNVPPERIREIVSDPETYRNLQCIPGSRPGIRKLREAGHHLFVVTARPLDSENITKEWVWQNFRGDFDDVRIVPFEQKAKIIKLMNPDVALDDSPAQLLGLTELGVRAICYTQPWNLDLDRRIPRVFSWKEFRHVLGA